MPSRLFSLRLMFDRSKLESLWDVNVTRIGDTLSNGFPQTVVVRPIADFLDLIIMLQNEHLIIDIDSRA